jgi:RNA polymerase sigma-54 factor
MQLTMRSRSQRSLRMRVAPTVVAYARLLALPEAQVQDVVEREMATNPALEVTGDDESGVPQSSRSDSSRLGLPALAGIECRVSDTDRLRADVGALLPATDGWIAEYVLADLDGRGLLDRTPVQLATSLGVPVERITRVISAIREIGPAGICAANVVEGLLLQLARWEANQTAPPLLRRILNEHFVDLALGELDSIAAALGATRAQVLTAQEFLRARLYPHPCRLDDPFPPPGPPADVILSWAEDLPGELLVEVADFTRPRVRLNEFCLELAHASRPPAGVTASEFDELCAQVERAEELVRLLGARASTLHKIACAVAQRQLSYLRDGPRRHLPLTRAEIAEAIHVHESTVSRGVADKHVQLPNRSLVPMSTFFGASCAAEAALLDLIRGQTRPASDTDLARSLAERGLVLSRRTVAKYRAKLGIPAFGTG